MSTSFHPQTNGQTKRVNQTLETYLCTFINYDQDDWYSLLPLAEFAYNNSVTQATQLTPFYTNYEYHPKIIWISSEEFKNPASKAYAFWIKATHDRAMQALEKTKDNMSKYYDQHHQPQPEYQVGDEVLLNARNIQTVRPTRKLAHKLCEPFRILARIGKSAYRLELQGHWRIHNVFHTSLLEPYRKNAFKGQLQIRLEPEEIEKEKEYKVEWILQSEVCTTRRKIGGRYKSFKSLYFLVQWKGYQEDESTWEPGTSLEHVSESIEKFYGENPEAPALMT
jgi:hypothetical protein